MANEPNESTPLRTMQVGLLNDIYIPSSVSLTICEFKTSRLSVEVATQSETETVVRFSAAPGADLDDSVVHDFLNRALERSIRATLQSS
jgi:hypothetical protein